MRFWGKRKHSAKSTAATLSMEKLEDRAMMAVIPLASGQTATFYDSDGTEVNVKLAGPGQGTIELVGGVLNGAAIDTLSLTGTTAATKLKISTRGGTVAGTSINDVAIDNALNELGALKHFKANKVTLTGNFTADGNIDDFCVRSLGNGATVEINGNVGRFKAESLASNAQLDVSGTLREFVARLLASGSVVEANQLDMLKVKQQAVGANFNIGDGGLTRAKLGWIYNTHFASQGDIGDVVVKGDAMGTGFASNIDAGSDHILGTIDDFVIDPSMPGHINSIKFRGGLGAKGTHQQVAIVTSGFVGDVKLSRATQHSGRSPKIWEQAAQQVMPLSIVQQYANATGYGDDQIWIAVFGTDLSTNINYYLSPEHVNNGIPALQQTNPAPNQNTPDLPLVKSYTLSDWKSASQTWGSNLAFPVPAENDQWSGRILISVGAPVQAQVNANGTVASPSPSNPIDPSTGTFYDFLEFTVSGPSIVKGNNVPANLDIDTSQVDAFGLPIGLQLFQQSPSVTSFTGTLTPSSNSITNIPNTAGLQQGQSVVGQGIPLGATISTVTASTTSVPGSITINMNTDSGVSGPQSLMAVAWNSYNVSLTGTIGPSSNTITGISSDTLKNLILNSNVSTSQPIIAANVLPEGTTIASYVIGTAGQNDSTITLTKNSLSSVTSGSFSFTIEPAGAVGVAAPRQAIMGTDSSSLIAFLQNQINGGNLQALPFLQSAYPYLLSGPVPISGVVNNLAALTVETTGTGILAQGDLVEISGVVGNTVANGVYAIASTTGTTFTLAYPISNGVYTGGGTVSAVNPGVITGAATAPIQVTTNTVAGLNVNDVVSFTGVPELTGNYIVAGVGTDSFTLGGPTSTGTYTAGTGYWYPAGAPTTAITGMTMQSGTFNISTPNTDGIAVNDLVLISGVNGLTGANGAFTVTSVGANSFTVSGATGTGSYVSGGNWQIVTPITGAAGTASSAIQISTNTPSLYNGTAVQIGGVGGVTEANGLFITSNVSGTGFTLGSPITSTAFSGTANWNSGASSGIVYETTVGGEVMLNLPSAPSVANGDWVTVSGVAGNTAANGTYKVRNLSGTTFLLEGTQGNGSYTFGGIYYEVPSIYTPITNVTGGGADQMTIDVDTSDITSSSIVLIQNVGGNTAANGLFLVDNLVSSTTGSFQIGAPVGNGNYDNNTWSMAITGTDTTSAYVAVSNPAGLNVGNTITITGVQNSPGTSGTPSVNGSFLVAAVDSNWIELGAPVGNANYTSGGYWTLPNTSHSILGGSSTSGQPVVITTGITTGLANNDLVQISGTSGNSAINGVYAVSDVTGTTFKIAAVNGNGTAITGGTWQRVQAITGATGQGVPIVITTGDTDAINIGGVVSIFGVGGNTNANGMFVVTDKTPGPAGTITLGSPAGTATFAPNTGSWTGSAGGSGAVTNALNGGAVEIHTSNTSGLNQGDLIQVTGVQGNAGANGVYTVTNVKTNVFTLQGSLSTGTYTRGGTWKEFGAIPRLVSPKDLVESLGNPQDKGELNNYFNELIDEFFLQYLPSSDSVNGFSGGGQTLQLVSTASGSAVTYNGVVTNKGTVNGGYVLRFTPSGGGSGPSTYQADTLDIYYPFFTSNAPSPDVYTPLFGVAAPPTWLVDLAKQNESATQMLFACDAVFADNTPRANLGMSSTAAKVIADLENLVSGAFNRGIALNPGSTWSDSTTWFPENGQYNYWVQYWHQSGLMYGDLAYAFAYDDKFGASTNLQISTPGLTQITLGGWGTQWMSASTTSLVLTLPNSVSPPVPQNQSVTLTATVTGDSPTGSVTFFVNGIPINSGNDSNFTPLDPAPVSNHQATLTANLPTLPAGTYTYTVTAVYSGDQYHLPSIGTTTIQVAG